MVSKCYVQRTKRTFSQLLEEKFISEVVGSGSIIIFHLSKLEALASQFTSLIAHCAHTENKS